MSPRRPARSTTSAFSALAVLAVAGTAVLAGTPAVGATTAASSSRTVVVAATDDAYTDSAFPKRNTGSADKVVAGITGTSTKTALLRFKVPAAPSGTVLSGARLTVTANRDLPARVDLRRLTTTAWTEETVTYASRVTPTTTIRSVAPAAGTRSVSFNVTSQVTAGTWRAFGITTPSGVADLASKEGVTGDPRLVLTYTATPVTAPSPSPTVKPTVTTSPTPTATASVTPKPTATATATANPTPTATATVTPTATPTATTPTATTPTATVAPKPLVGVKIGMSSPAGQWDERLKQTGGVDGRRVFDDLATPSFAIDLAKSEAAAGRMPILSFKVPNNDWAGAGRGVYDAQLKNLARELAAVDGQVFVTLHHEPTGDGTPADYAAMMRHTLPILGAPANVDAGPIVNGFWWSAGARGYTDAEIAQWLPADVLKVSEIVASDTYQGGTAADPGENAGVKIRRMSAWADRTGVTRLGIGEYNGVDAASITAAGDALLADRRYVFAAIFNSSVNNREGIDWTLTGDRLTAFQETVARARAARTGS